MNFIKFKHNTDRRKPKVVFVCLFLFLCCSGWGFFGHRQINRHAVFLLPTEMSGFFKHHIEYIEEASVNPDKRRYAVKGEAARHYIDLDRYHGKELPHQWTAAVECYGADSLEAHGVLPWNLIRAFGSLENAFLLKDPDRILKLSADLGHYVGDAHVPLHTTSNYDGQETGQHGLHGFWESRLPELYFSEYDFLIGSAEFVDNPQKMIWNLILNVYDKVDSVLVMERRLFSKMSATKYGFETRSGMTVKAVTPEYSQQYHQMLDGMVERQMRCAVKCLSDLWFTAWVNAGQPDLDSLKGVEFGEEILAARRLELQSWKERNFKPRDHESGDF